MASSSADEPEKLAPLPAARRELAVANGAILADCFRKFDGSDIVASAKLAITERLPSETPSVETVAQTLKAGCPTRPPASRGSGLRAGETP